MCIKSVAKIKVNSRRAVHCPDIIIIFCMMHGRQVGFRLLIS